MGVIETRQLQCGMTLIVETMSGVRSAGLTWLLPNGCACDPLEKQGLAAIWSEIVMRGAGTRDSRAHADALDRLGVSRSTEARTFTFRIGASMLGERLSESFELITDMVLKPRMDGASVEPCRDLALQNLASLADEPQDRAVYAARERHHPDPLSRSGLGTPEGLKAVTEADLRDIWAKYARPKSSVIAIAGAVDASDIEHRLNDLLGDWSGEAPKFSTGPAPVRGYGHLNDESNQVQIILLHDAPTEKDPDSLLEKVVMMVLSGGMAGRLFTEVREKRGLCYSVNAGYAGDRDFGIASAYVGTTPERAQQSLDVLYEQLQFIMTPAGRITDEEFARAIVGMKSSLVFSGESSGARAASLAADYRRLGRPRSLDELAAEIDALTPGIVNDYLARRRMGRWTIQTLGPAPLTPPANC